MNRSLGTLGLPKHVTPEAAGDDSPSCDWCGRSDCAGSLRIVEGVERFCCNPCEVKGAYRQPPEERVARETPEVAERGPKIPMKAIRKPGKQDGADPIAGLASMGRKKT